MQYKVNHAELSYSLPTHLQSTMMIQGESPITENCPETQDLPISHPQQLSVLSIAGPPLGGRDRWKLSPFFKIFTLAWVSFQQAFKLMLWLLVKQISVFLCCDSNISKSCKIKPGNTRNLEGGKLMQKGNQKKLEIYPLSLNSVPQTQSYLL